MGPRRDKAVAMAPILPLLLLSQSFAAPRVLLYTFGHDEELFTRYGHAALCLRDEGAVGGACYSYGYADFSDALGTVLKFMRRRGVFWGDVEEEGDLLARYVHRDSDIWRQELVLPDDQVVALEARLQASLEPSVRAYSYHYFYDNCATRLRDPLDEVTGGRLSAGGREPDGSTWRELAENGLAGFLPLQVLLQVSLGREADQHTSAWDRMFLPAELREQAEKKLGAAPEQLYTRRGSAIPDTARQGRQVVAGLGLTLAGLLALIRRLRPGSFWRASALVLGLPALIPWTVSIVSTLSDLRWNETLLLLWPTDLLLGRLKPASRARYLRLRLGGLGLAVLLWAAGLLTQPHGPTLMLVGAPLLLCWWAVKKDQS